MQPDVKGVWGLTCPFLYRKVPNIVPLPKSVPYDTDVFDFLILIVGRETCIT
jgi:hypothetical protein